MCLEPFFWSTLPTLCGCRHAIYVSVAMRLTCTHELSETALEAETLDAEKEWKEVQARWQEMRHEDGEL